MKKICIAVVALLITATTFAQKQQEEDSIAFVKAMEFHLLKRFPGKMPYIVLNETKVEYITEKMGKKSKDYNFSDGVSTPVAMSLAEGDKILYFRGEPYYSTMMNLFISEIPKTTKPARQGPSGFEKIVGGVMTVVSSPQGQMLITNAIYNNRYRY